MRSKTDNMIQDFAAFIAAMEQQSRQDNPRKAAPPSGREATGLARLCKKLRRNDPDTIQVGYGDGDNGKLIRGCALELGQALRGNVHMAKLVVWFSWTKPPPRRADWPVSAVCSITFAVVPL
jgi:hypothetical protein